MLALLRKLFRMPGPDGVRALTHFEYMVMMAIRAGHELPLQMMDFITWAGSSEPNLGRIYSTLDRLDREGLIAVTYEPRAADKGVQMRSRLLPNGLAAINRDPRPHLQRANAEDAQTVSEPPEEPQQKRKE